MSDLSRVYSFTVWNPLRKHDITYDVKRTATGWHISYNAHTGDCDREGAPLFYNNFNQDSIIYPNLFGHELDVLWEKAERNNLPDDDVERRLNNLADWVIACTKARP